MALEFRPSLPHSTLPSGGKELATLYCDFITLERQKALFKAKYAVSPFPISETAQTAKI
jgi:hypothetical protein